MKALPKISIIVPSLNKAKFLKEALNSIINQKYPNIEVLIYDGGSTDGSLFIIDRYLKKYPKVFRLVSKQDSGQLDAINQGFSLASGVLISFLNADDILSRGALKAIGEFYIKYPNSLWFAGKGKIIDGSGKQISVFVTNYKNWLINKNKFTNLLIVNYLTQSSVYITKKAFITYGPFNGIQKIVMEYEMWLRLGQQQMPTIIDKELSCFRLIQSGFSLTNFKRILAADDKIAHKFTNDIVILMLHWLHNSVRALMAVFIFSYEK